MSQKPIRFCWNWIINKRSLNKKKNIKTPFFREFEDFVSWEMRFFVPQGLDSLASVEFQNTLVKAENFS